MTGTPDVTVDFESKTELDFRNRLIAKFAIPRAKKFWSSGFEATPKTALYPAGDIVEDICQEVTVQLRTRRSATAMGQFIIEWSLLEERLMGRARQVTERNVSVRDAIRQLSQRQKLPEDIATELDQLRHIRNMVVHRPSTVEPPDVEDALRRLRNLQKRIPPDAA